MTEIPLPWVTPVVPLWPDAGEWLGFRSRSASHDAAGRGEIPTIRLGARLMVPTAELYALVGLAVPPHPSLAVTVEAETAAPVTQLHASHGSTSQAGCPPTAA
jgi:hypothetical protein